MAQAYNKFNSFVEELAEKAHNLGSDTLKVMLSNTAVNATFTDTSHVTEISAEHGYDAGGSTVTVTSSAQSGGTYSLIADDLVFTATNGTIGPLRYAVLYNDSADDKLIGWWDYGSSITLSDGETLTIDWDATNGILSIA